MKTYDLTTDQSGMFFRVGYDAETFTLRLGFRKNGRVYDYFGVPHAEAGRLMFSKMSEVFNARIRDNYEVKEVTEQRITRSPALKIYVASSWRNEMQPQIVRALTGAGHEVYDFRHPGPGKKGFAWSEIDPDWLCWKSDDYIRLLRHPIAEEGFRLDFDAMQWADAFVLVLPSGRSAHLEAGWAIGQGKPCFILTRDGEEPELMAKMATGIVNSVDGLLEALQ